MDRILLKKGPFSCSAGSVPTGVKDFYGWERDSCSFIRGSKREDCHGRDGISDRLYFMAASAGVYFFFHLCFRERCSPVSFLSSYLTACFCAAVISIGRFSAFLVCGRRQGSVGTVIVDNTF